MLTPLAAALERVTPEHAQVLEWFVAHEGEIGPRPWRVDGHSVIPGIELPVVAQRGIHQPSGWSLALSVTATRASVYLDGRPEPVDAETWVLPYRAHAGGDGSGSASQWNRALIENWRTRTPVGVFVPERRTYRNLGLAVVESYDPGSDTFLLRGPVRPEQPATTWEYALQDEELSLSDPTASEAEVERVAALVKRRLEQNKFRERLLIAYSGQCAVTGCDAPDALQGAHILAYSGRSSQAVENGLLLRADVHLLFDRHLLSIDPSDMVVRLARPLRRTCYGPFEGRRLGLPVRSEQGPSREKLRVHWAVFGRGAA